MLEYAQNEDDLTSIGKTQLLNLGMGLALYERSWQKNSLKNKLKTRFQLSTPMEITFHQFGVKEASIEFLPLAVRVLGSVSDYSHTVPMAKEVFFGFLILFWDRSLTDRD